MNIKLKSMAMIDIVEYLLKNQKEPMTIQEIIQKVKEIKEMSGDDVDRLTQLYMDITQSAKFVYCGEDKWDLKERNLEMWDKDGYAFITLEDEKDDEEDVEEDLDFTEFILEDEEVKDEKIKEVDEDEEKEQDEDAKEAEEEKEYIDVKLPIKSTDDDDEDDVEIEFDGDYDEDDYNEIMDDYEDMYDEE